MTTDVSAFVVCAKQAYAQVNTSTTNDRCRKYKYKHPMQEDVFHVFWRIIYL